MTPLLPALLQHGLLLRTGHPRKQRAEIRDSGGGLAAAHEHDGRVVGGEVSRDAVVVLPQRVDGARAVGPVVAHCLELGDGPRDELRVDARPVDVDGGRGVGDAGVAGGGDGRVVGVGGFFEDDEELHFEADDERAEGVQHVHGAAVEGRGVRVGEERAVGELGGGGGVGEVREVDVQVDRRVLPELAGAVVDGRGRGEVPVDDDVGAEEYSGFAEAGHADAGDVERLLVVVAWVHGELQAARVLALEAELQRVGEVGEGDVEPAEARGEVAVG